MPTPEQQQNDKAEDSVKVKGIINALRKSKQLEKEFRESLLNIYNVGDKALSTWDKESEVEKLPVDPDPAICRARLSKLVDQVEQISKAYRQAKVTEITMKAAYEQEYDLAFEAVFNKAMTALQEGKTGRLPAEKTLAALAEAGTKDVKQALHHAKAAVEYFKTTLDKLHDQREGINSILVSLGIEAKLR